LKRRRQPLEGKVNREGGFLWSEKALLPREQNQKEWRSKKKIEEGSVRTFREAFTASLLLSRTSSISREERPKKREESLPHAKRRSPLRN